MTDRDRLLIEFLDASGWAGAEQSPLAGDASNRRYLRIQGVAGKPDAVLMDAPKERGEDVRPFVSVARHLLNSGLSAPEIYATDIDNGFLLLEDLGDTLFSTLCTEDPELERPIYEAAVDALIALQQAPAPKLDLYAPELMAELGAQVLDWYALGREGRVPEDQKSALRAALHDALQTFGIDFKVPVLRDYHAQNLLWLPERSGVARVGLLDFQDAMIGHPTYDLVSLLEDARRDVSPSVQQHLLTYFITRTGADPDLTRAAYATMGAQRNLRILMVFARLSLHYGKDTYVNLIPRTMNHLLRNLEHPHLADLKEIVVTALPPASPETLTELKEKCGTHPTR